ncbi:MAG: hypothetical protein Q8O76_01940, partial [Chloroflexota bacterium]|nr:hypothetical protein [Chloroflexota bacterium]
MRVWKRVTLLASIMGLIILACTPVATPTTTPTPASTPTGPRGPARTLPYAPSVTPTSVPTPTPVSAPARAPIITEAQAIEMGALFARFGGPEVSGSQQVRNSEARLMTLAEFEDRFSGYQSTGDRSRPVWVVTVEGEWSDAGIVPPEY